MNCPKCGAKTIEGDNFCEECGASLKKAVDKECDPESTKAELKSGIVVVDSTLAEVSNVGIKHPKNEDAGTVAKCEDGSYILVVSDGVSSALNSTTASQEAVEKVKEVLSGSQGDEINLVSRAINEANELVLGLPYETRTDGIYGPEATIVAAKVVEGIATIGWVGDSRAYIISKTEQRLLTVDDSWVEYVVASGEMTREDAMKDRRSHCVTQVLGMHDQAMEIHLVQHKIEEGEMLLLCSDGLWNYLESGNDLQKAILDFSYEKDAIEICEHLVSLANDAGGHDNITVAILKY